MSIFETDYQRGFNAGRGQQASDQLLSILNQQREQTWVQRQFQSLQGQLQAVQLENMRLQQENARLCRDNAEYERFSNWAKGEIASLDQSIANLQSMLDVWIKN